MVAADDGGGYAQVSSRDSDRNGVRISSLEPPVKVAVLERVDVEVTSPSKPLSSTVVVDQSGRPNLGLTLPSTSRPRATQSPGAGSLRSNGAMGGRTGESHGRRPGGTGLETSRETSRLFPFQQCHASLQRGSPPAFLPNGCTSLSCRHRADRLLHHLDSGVSHFGAKLHLGVDMAIEQPVSWNTGHLYVLSPNPVVVYARQ